MGNRDLINPSQEANIEAYVRLLGRWRSITNLISSRDFAEVWERHVLDSVRLQRVAPDANVWLDIGAGAGFPGIILGILLRERASAKVHCVESDGRKCAFLRTVAQSLDLPVKVYNARAETITSAQTGAVDAVTARAFSSIAKILHVADSYLDGGAEAVLPRGKSAVEEVARLDRSRYSVTSESNPAAPGAVFLRITSKVRGL